MYLIIGLGNPGSQYAKTRHNVGFIVLDELQEKFAGGSRWQGGFQGQYCKANLHGKSCILFKPLTYMNLSGRAVYELSAYFKIPTKKMIVIHDDIDLEPMTLKSRAGGGHGGNNGIRSMIDELGDADFNRIKIGVGKPAVGTVADWVLGALKSDALQQINNDLVPEILLRIKSVFQQDKDS